MEKTISIDIKWMERCTFGVKNTSGSRTKDRAAKKSLGGDLDAQSA